MNENNRSWQEENVHEVINTAKRQQKKAQREANTYL